MFHEEYTYLTFSPYIYIYIYIWEPRILIWNGIFIEKYTVERRTICEEKK